MSTEEQVVANNQALEHNPPVETPAEGDPNAQDIEASAPPAHTDGEKPETPEQAERRRQRSLGRKLDKAYRRAAEAEARAKFIEEQHARVQQQQALQRQQDPGAPKLEDFSDIDEFRKAIEKHASQQTVRALQARQVAAQKQQYLKQLTDGWEGRVAEAESKYDDFDEKVGDLKPNSALTIAIMESENGPDIAHYLADHLDEAQAIAQLPALAQIRAIGRLEAKLLAAPAKPKTPSKAPAPISPVNGGSGATNEMPSDKDDINTWMRKENERMRKLNA